MKTDLEPDGQMRILIQNVKKSGYPVSGLARYYVSGFQ